MPSRSKTPIHFGEGLDRETGLMQVNPTNFSDLRNVLLHEGKLILRPGFLAAGTGLFPEVTVLIAGEALKSDALGIVVGYHEANEEVHIYRVSPDLSIVELLGEWVHDQVGGWGANIPRVIMAEVFGRVFMAHDEELVTRRASTQYYDPITGVTLLNELTADFDQSLGSVVGPVRFRGVVRHLAYLAGWGFGSTLEIRPELVRFSLPGEPLTFDHLHYFSAGDRRDPVLACGPAGQAGNDVGSVLNVWKRTETHAVFGFDRRTFGIREIDSRYGIVASRAWVNVDAIAVAWSEEGPRAWTGLGASEPLELPLGLEEWEPDDLVDEGSVVNAFAHFVPRERVAWFHFNRRVYALTARIKGRWRWSYQELGFDSYGAMTFFATTAEAVAPVGYPVYVPPGGLVTGIPAIIKTAIAAWRIQDIDVAQTRMLPDRSGNGAHLYFGPPAAKDAILGDGPLGVGKRGVVSTEQADRGLGFPNTAQVLNVGALGVNQTRIVVNFSCHLEDGIQTIIAHDSSAATRAWWIQLTNTAQVVAGFSEDGTAISELTTAETLDVTPAPVFANWDDVWLRVTFDVAADTIQVESSVDGVVWDAFTAATAVTARASIFQQAAAVPVEFGGRTLQTIEKMNGGGVYSILIEEDSGAGYVEAWTFAGSTVPYSGLEEIGNQQLADAADPAIVGAPATHLAIVRNVSECRTWETALANATDLMDQFDVAIGESLTLVLYVRMNPVNAGPAGFYTPFSKKSTGAGGDQGWVIENNGAVEGFIWMVSDGATQSATLAVAPVDDDELAVSIYEVLAVELEVAMRKLINVPTTAAYVDQGSGTNAFGLMFGRTGAAGFGMTMEFHAAAVFKKALTVGEQVDVGNWMTTL